MTSHPTNVRTRGRISRLAVALAVAPMVLLAGAVYHDVARRRAPAPERNYAQAARETTVELMQDESAVAGAVLASAQVPTSMTDLRDRLVPARGRAIQMEVTAYCACTKCCGPNAQGVTASGKPVSFNNGRFVAADTSVLPFGTKLLIPGYHGEPVEVADRGGAIKGNKLDVFFADHQEALRWGRQKLTVTVVD
jgi:3D (Asp-Asp-Asp) domain-containing protein